MASRKTANRLHSRNVKHGGMNIGTPEQEAYDADEFYEEGQPTEAWRVTNNLGEGKVEDRHPLEIIDTDYDWEQQNIQNLKSK